ncbi:MAG: hypothetical protein IJA75_00265 [Oscillospiraceae bacterium]|nr:hypothetical protein [Oscillospiraceae bacterium]
MKPILLYPIGSTEAIRYAVSQLHKEGTPIIDHPAPEVTHLLLDIPAFAQDGTLRGGGTLQHHLERLPPETVVVGGNLNHPGLAEHRTVDFLSDESYLAQNASITAHCALKVAAPLLKATFADIKVLVIGWGRIGKHLAKLLRALGASVTVAARSEKDQAMLHSLGYTAVDYSAPPPPCHLVFNTVPSVYEGSFSESCMKIELASRPGLTGDGILSARGLPGIYAPESSGALIAKTFLRLCKGESK